MDPISCDLYDYIEIACLYKIPVRLELKDGSFIEGNADDTIINDDKDECMKLGACL